MGDTPPHGVIVSLEEAPSLKMWPTVDGAGRIASVEPQEAGGGDGRLERPPHPAPPPPPSSWGGEFSRCREELEGERAMRTRLSLELSKANSELELQKLESEEGITALLQEKKHLLLQIDHLHRELEATEVEVSHLKSASESLSQEGGSSLRAMQTEVSTKAQAYQAELCQLRVSSEEVRGRCRQLEHQVELLEGQVREYQNQPRKPAEEVARSPEPAPARRAKQQQQQQQQLNRKERESYESQIQELQDAMDGLRASTRVQVNALDSECAQVTRRSDEARAESQSAISQVEQDLGAKEGALAGMAVALKEERLRGSGMARDKVRMGVEHEALQRKLHHAVEEMTRLEAEAKSVKLQLQDQVRQGRQLDRERKESDEMQTILAGKLEALQQQLALADVGRADLMRECESLKDQLKHSLGDRDLLALKLSHLAEEHEALRVENVAIEGLLRAAEAEVMALRTQSRGHRESIAKLTGDLEAAKEVATEHQRLQSRCRSLMEEVRDVMQRRLELEREVTAKDKELEQARFRESGDSQELQSIRLRCETLVKDNASLKEQAWREASIATARQEAVEAAEERAEAAIASKRALKSQLGELQASFIKSVAERRQLEEEALGWQAQVAVLQEELKGLRVQTARTREAIREAETAQQLAVEVENLRQQLAVTRSAMVGGTKSPGESKSELDRLRAEAQRQKVYEGVVNSLRVELAEESQQRAKLQERLQGLKMEADKSHQLEQEVEYLTLQAHKVQAACTVTEDKLSQAKRGEFSLTQERDAAAHEATRANDVVAFQVKDIEHLTGALEHERRRAEMLAEEMGRKEMSAAELFAAASRAELALENAREETSKQKLDLLYSDQSVATSSDKLNQLQRDYLILLDAHEALEAESGSLRARLDEVKQGEAQAVVQRDLSTASSLAQGHDQRAQTLKRALAEKDMECQGMQDQLSKMKELLGLSKLMGLQSESSKASQQVQGLRLELDCTVAGWDQAEKARQAREESASKLRASLQGQIEKNSLLTTQLGLLKEQVRFLNEELEVYRQLDVYSTTLEHEFRSFRQRRQGDLQPPSVSAPPATGGLQERRVGSKHSAYS